MINDLCLYSVYWPITEASTKTGFSDISNPQAQFSAIYYISADSLSIYPGIKGFGPLEKTVSGANIIRRLAGSPYPELKAKYDRYFGG